MSEPRQNKPPEVDLKFFDRVCEYADIHRISLRLAAERMAFEKEQADAQ